MFSYDSLNLQNSEEQDECPPSYTLDRKTNHSIDNHSFDQNVKHDHEDSVFMSDEYKIDNEKTELVQSSMFVKGKSLICKLLVKKHTINYIKYFFPDKIGI